jgi:Na+/proline symporter
MWSFANNDPKPFATQQVWASSFGIGLILFFFTAFQGMGAHLLGANPLVNEANLGISTVLSDAIAKKPDSLVPYYINQIADAAPWLVGLLAVCALAAMQSTGAAYMSTAGGMLTRDLYKRFLNPTASHEQQKLWGRIGVAFIVVAALLVATFSRDALVLLGGLAVAFGFQMWPSLVAVC